MRRDDRTNEPSGSHFGHDIVRPGGHIASDLGRPMNTRKRPSGSTPCRSACGRTASDTTLCSLVRLPERLGAAQALNDLAQVTLRKFRARACLSHILGRIRRPLNLYPILGLLIKTSSVSLPQDEKPHLTGCGFILRVPRRALLCFGTDIGSIGSRN